MRFISILSGHLYKQGVSWEFVLVRLGKWGLVSKDPALALVLYVPDYHQLTSAVKARFPLLQSSLSFFSQPCPSLPIMLAILHLGWAKCTTPFWSRLAKLQRNFAHWPKFCHSTIHAPEGLAVILIEKKIH